LWSDRGKKEETCRRRNKNHDPQPSIEKKRRRNLWGEGVKKGTRPRAEAVSKTKKKGRRNAQVSLEGPLARMTKNKAACIQNRRDGVLGRNTANRLVFIRIKERVGVSSYSLWNRGEKREGWWGDTERQKSKFYTTRPIKKEQKTSILEETQREGEQRLTQTWVAEAISVDKSSGDGLGRGTAFTNTRM